MRYHSQYERSPSDDLAQRFVDYLNKNGIISGPSGLPADDRERDGFRDFVSSAEMSRLHTVNFAEDHTAEEIQDALRSVANDRLDGEVLISVHTETETNHGYIGQAGSEDQCYQDVDDMTEIRSAIADEFEEESIG